MFRMYQYCLFLFFLSFLQPLFSAASPSLKSRNYGAKNERLSCFLNASVQALFHAQPLREFLQKAKSNKYYPDVSIGSTFIEYIDEMAQSKKAVNPRVFRNYFAGMEEGQHDAQEFYLTLIAKLLEDIGQPDVKKKLLLTAFDEKYKKYAENKLWFFLQNLSTPKEPYTDEFIKNSFLERVEEQFDNLNKGNLAKPVYGNFNQKDLVTIKNKII